VFNASKKRYILGILELKGKNQKKLKKGVDILRRTWYYSQALERESKSESANRTLKIKQRDERRTREFWKEFNTQNRRNRKQNLNKSVTDVRDVES